jgi:hypothetical protein
MCYNAESSLISYIVATGVALYVMNRPAKINKILGGILLIFSTIQLLEFLIWTDRRRSNLSYTSSQALQYGFDDPRNRASSDLITRLILVALWLQPLGFIYLAYQYGRPSNLLNGALVVYLFLFVYALSRALNPEISFGSRPFVGPSTGGLFADTLDSSGQGHLQWTASDGYFLGPNDIWILYLIGLFLGFLFTEPAIIGHGAIVFNLFPMLYSYRRHTQEEFSSMWCVYALLFAGFILIVA